MSGIYKRVGSSYDEAVSVSRSCTMVGLEGRRVAETRRQVKSG